MKKYSLLLLLVGLPLSIYSVSITGEVSGFLPVSSSIREIYGTVWPDFGVNFDHLCPLPNELPSLNVFGQVNYILSSGKSIGARERTEIRLLPLTLGLNWRQKIFEKLELVLGIAPRYYFMSIKNHSYYIPRTTHNQGLGAYLTTGCFYYPTDHLMIKLFFSYSYKQFGPPAHLPGIIGLKTDVSSFDLGAGLGWKF